MSMLRIDELQQEFDKQLTNGTACTVGMDSGVYVVEFNRYMHWFTYRVPQIVAYHLETDKLVYYILHMTNEVPDWVK